MNRQYPPSDNRSQRLWVLPPLWENRQSGHQQGYKSAVMASMEGNVHCGGGNQYVGPVTPSGPRRTNDETMLRVTANWLVRNNRFDRQGLGNQVIGQTVSRGGIPMAFSGQYQGNINEGPGHQYIGIVFE